MLFEADDIATMVHLDIEGRLKSRNERPRAFGGRCGLHDAYMAALDLALALRKEIEERGVKQQDDG
jgi:hypothetical protein